MKATAQAQIILVFLGLAGMAIALVSTSVYGVGLSPDSVAYIFAARSLLSGDGFIAFGGDSFVAWPPLFPTLLAGLGLVDIEPLDGARFFNAVVFGLIIFTTGHLLRNHLRTWTIVILGTASLLVSVILVRVSIMAWSEPLFVLLTILFVIYLSKFITQQRFFLLLLIGILAALACLQRYLGFTLVLTGFISIAFFMRTKTFQDKFKYLAFFSLVSATPIAVWLGRNYWLTSTFVGDMSFSYTNDSSTNFLVNVGDIFYSGSTWLLPINYMTSSSVRTIFVILGVSVLAALVTLALRSHLRGRSNLQVAQFVPAAIFVTVYILSLLVIRTRFSFYAPVGDRLLSPVYVFVLLFILLGIEKMVQASTPIDQHRWNSQRLWLILGLFFALSGVFFNEWTVSRLLFFGEVKNQWVLANLVSADGSIRAPFRAMILLFGISSVLLGLLVITLRRKPWIGRLVIVGLCSIWLMYPVAQTYIYVSTKTDSGAGGYNSAGWRNSALIDRLKLDPLDGAIYSNAPYAIYILTQTSGTSSPRRFPYDDLTLWATATAQLRAAIDSNTNNTYLVWIDNQLLLDPKRASEDFGNVSLMFDLEEIARYSDGGIYLFK